MKDSLRIFVGIFPSQPTRERLGEKAANWCDRLRSEVRLLAPELLHLTIKFIGNVDKTKLEELTTAFDRAKDNLPSASLQITQLMLFPTNRKPRVVAAKVERSPELLEIFQVFDRGFANLGIAIEKRRFRPHITLARTRRWQSETVFSTPLQINEPIESIALVSSQLTPQGAKYKVVDRIKLGRQSPLSQEL